MYSCSSRHIRLEDRTTIGFGSSENDGHRTVGPWILAAPSDGAMDLPRNDRVDPNQLRTVVRRCRNKRRGVTVFEVLS